jgi:hypothetical protein
MIERACVLNWNYLTGSTGVKEELGSSELKQILDATKGAARDTVTKSLRTAGLVPAGNRRMFG